MNDFLSIQFAGQTLHLLPDRAIYWPERSALIVADLHLGKASGFRSHGIPVPSGSTSKDLNRLNALIQKCDAKHLYILGDFYHSKKGINQQLIDSITKWRQSIDTLHIKLIRGNHDRASGRAEACWKFEELDGVLDDAPFSFSHMDGETGRFPTLCGHVHPVVQLQDFDGSVVRAPCFVVDENQLILPSFGTFTGGYVVHRQPQRRIFLTTGKRIVPYLV